MSSEEICTIWVCYACRLHHLNGGCSECRFDGGHAIEPWSSLLRDEWVTAQKGNDPYSDSTAACGGCGSREPGTRYPFTLWQTRR